MVPMSLHLLTSSKKSLSHQCRHFDSRSMYRCSRRAASIFHIMLIFPNPATNTRTLRESIVMVVAGCGCFCSPPYIYAAPSLSSILARFFLRFSFSLFVRQRVVAVVLALVCPGELARGVNVCRAFDLRSTFSSSAVAFAVIGNASLSLSLGI